MKRDALDMLPSLVRPAEAAKALGCSVKTLSRRKLPAIRHGNIVRYSKAVLAEYIRQCTVEDKQPEGPPSTPSQEPRAARRIGSRGASSLLSGVLAKSPRDQLNEAFQMISELRAKGSHSAKGGTGKPKNSSKTRGEPSPSRELSKIT